MAWGWASPPCRADRVTACGASVAPPNEWGAGVAANNPGPEADGYEGAIAMGNVRAGSSPAESWPPWTDEDRWGIGPDPSDAGWAAERNEAWDADDGPAPDDPIWDEWAEEATNQDLMDRGFRPF